MIGFDENILLALMGFWYQFEESNQQRIYIFFWYMVAAHEQTTIKGSHVNSRKLPVSYGPWGGSGGTIFDDGVYTGVREIHLTRCGGSVSIRVCYDLNGEVIWGSKQGGNSGIRMDKVVFYYPSEILTHVTGYYGSTMLRGPTAIKSLTFHTNKKKYGPFGDEQGISFSSGSNLKGVIVGFHGRKGWFIDSIGVHVVEAAQSWGPLPHTYVSSDKNHFPNHEVVHGLVKEHQLGSGGWGGVGGNPWDDGTFSGIKKIFLTKGEAIYCIQTEYDRNGQSAWSNRHGGASEGSSHTIKFEYPREILTSICGYYGYISGGDEGSKGGVIKSLTFYTNKGKYGPYGEETGTFFSSTKTDGKIVGFYGKSGSYLNAIGVHLQPWPELGQQPQGERAGGVRMIVNKFFN